MAAGQMITRKMGAGPGGQDILYFIGIIPDDGQFKDDNQYTVIVSDGMLVVVPGTEIDRKEELRGMGANNILQEPIWRIG